MGAGWLSRWSLTASLPCFSPGSVYLCRYTHERDTGHTGIARHASASWSIGQVKFGWMLTAECGDAESGH